MSGLLDFQPGRRLSPQPSALREYLRALIASSASIFVMENVPQILDSGEYVEFADAIKDGGVYRLDARVLNVADYGVPQ